MLLSASTLTWTILTDRSQRIYRYWVSHFSVSKAALHPVWYGWKYRELPTWWHYLDENVQDLAKAATDVFTTVINELLRAMSNLTLRTFSLQQRKHDITHIAQLLFNLTVIGSKLNPSLTLSLWQRSAPSHQMEKLTVTSCRNWLVLLLYPGML